MGGTCDAQLADTGIVSNGNLGGINLGAPGCASATVTSFAAPVLADSRIEACAALLGRVVPEPPVTPPPPPTESGGGGGTFWPFMLGLSLAVLLLVLGRRQTRRPGADRSGV